jgi:hypothetical protein
MQLAKTSLIEIPFCAIVFIAHTIKLRLEFTIDDSTSNLACKRSALFLTASLVNILGNELAFGCEQMYD